MEPKTNETADPKRKPFTAGVAALAVISLLAGASVSATLEEFAAPVYAENDPYAGAVDDTTGEDTWGEIDADKRDKGVRGLIGKAMKNRIDDRMEDREEHLEKRIQIDSDLIVAFQHCIDSATCTADSEVLSEMAERLSSTVEDMQAKLDGIETDDYANEGCEEKGGIWTEAPDRGGGHYFCDWGEKHWEERKDWSDEEKIGFAEDKMEKIEAARIAIAFCMASDDCEADLGTLRLAVTHMTDRANHHMECRDDRKCDRDHDDRRGIAERIRRAYCERTDRCDRDATNHDWVMTQENCEERGGTWTEAPDRAEAYYCDWGEDASGSDEDRESDESDRRDSNEEPGQ
ncbi:MAG: hypothetical protein QGG21_02515 [Candidatus Thalassarchaeaceae archaeon]|jgi:hypothetical protein|nr:hypothetical protein [Candidatus Thalassarchaeaceae archaeon]